MTVPEAWEIAERTLVVCAAISVVSIAGGALLEWLVRGKDDAESRR
jgi:hypothetical protein